MSLHLTTTQWVIASATVLLLGYDTFAVLKGGVENTISWQIVDISKKIPFVPFALGFLMGHFFGGMC